jgi:UDP-2-acetamido-3-amino-2,3-dideoxy-glucuronate N-acetyltransferase
MEFENGISGHISVSWLNPFKEHKLVVISDKKMIVFEDSQIWEKKLSIVEYNFNNSIINVEKKDSQYIDVPESEPLMEECKYFIKLINKEVKNITDGIEGRRVLEILTKANKHNTRLD